MGPSSSAATLLVARSARSSSLASSSSSSSAAYALTHQQQRRTFLFGLFGKKKKDKPNPFAQPPPKKPLLAQDDLFHIMSKSPFPPVRERAERIKRLAPCPVHLARGQRVLVQYECPQSGWPTHYSEKEWNEDLEKGKYIHRLREANEDEHDLRSGREMTEFKLPGPQEFEEAINMSSWDVYFYTRGHQSIESERSRRHASKLMSFPMTVGGVLHENSPYTTRNRRMTREGLRSFLGESSSS
jgi:mitochondrial splicing suppressor protein 51